MDLFNIIYKNLKNQVIYKKCKLFIYFFWKGLKEKLSTFFSRYFEIIKFDQIDLFNTFEGNFFF